MPLPNFVVTGNLKEILGDVAGTELVETAMTRARVRFTNNVASDIFILWNGTLERHEPLVIGFVDTDGNLTLENGSPVRLLANDPGLTFTGLQWQVSIDLPASAIPPLSSAKMRPWWIDAANDGQTINLGTTAPVPGADIHGVAGLTTSGLLTMLANNTSDLRVALDALYTGGSTGSFNLPAAIHAATSKATPVDADELALVDSAASNGLKKLTVANLKVLVQALVDAGVSAVVAGAPGALNTLDELAAAFGDDANFAASMTTALGLKAPLASPSFTGTVSGITKAMVGLGSADNTADTAKPVSTAQQTALNLKAPLASPSFSGTVSGVTAAMVGLGNVDNTDDASKPVSTAQAAADDAVLTSATGRAIAFAVALG